MLRKKTVIVLGAGSSAEFGLPAGTGLANSVGQLTDFYFDQSGNQTSGDRDLYLALKQGRPVGNEVVVAGRRISQGLHLSRSIDDFLYNHGEDDAVVAVGKAAIAMSILRSERDSKIFDFYSHDELTQKTAMKTLEKTWIFKLFQFLQTGVRPSRLSEIFSGLTFINFNYDRCVEVFMFHALQVAYGISSAEAATVIDTLDMTHPYGKVGALPWQGVGPAGIDFGELPKGERLLRLAEQIKTFTEQSQSNEEKELWRSRIVDAEQLVFLGFGFHAQNMELLRLETPLPHGQSVYATIHGASHSDSEVFDERIHRSLGLPRSARNYDAGQIQLDLAPVTCFKFVSDTGLRLAS